MRHIHCWKYSECAPYVYIYGKSCDSARRKQQYSQKATEKQATGRVLLQIRYGKEEPRCRRGPQPVRPSICRPHVRRPSYYILGVFTGLKMCCVLAFLF